MSAASPTTILFFIQVITDVDLLRPIVAEARRRAGASVRIVVIAKAFRRTPELRRILADTLPEFETIDEDDVESGAAPRLDGVGAVFSATESSAPAHRAAHSLARRANRLGLRTYTMQHGYESVGLTWFDADYPPGAIRFESRTIFTWGPLERLHSDVLPETRAKCVAVGCGRAATPAALARPEGRGSLVAVFENLHWNRYPPPYRSAFLRNLESTAREHPDTTFVVRPHPRGKWLTRHCDEPLPRAANVVIAPSEDPRWTSYCAPALIEFADGVITTPSSVALDAAVRGRPTAVVADGLDLAAYAPLPLLQRGEDWDAFVSGLAPPRRAALAERAARFVEASILPGDGAVRIVDRLISDAGQGASTNGAPSGTADRAAAAAAGAADGGDRRLPSR